ncbi:hypothetical protein H6P81_002701 [Aristolochia fimbriata]|uniref:Protein kinase domain-containing protein n=1 Tax=Aristolochia fimbriata TaxID=158543 RepID=A0AAV7FF24_ARIFI|nr:hypothetical protein H6P81_002701 [Aristolochia fimbriata]
MAFPFNLLFTSLFLILSFSLDQSQELASTDPAYYYNLCSTSTCGNLSLPYPFAFPTFCGHPDIKVTCTDNVLLCSSELPEAEPNRVVSNFSFDAAGISVSIAFISLFGCGPVTRKHFIVGRGPFSLDNEYNYGTHLNCTQPPRSAAPGSLVSSSCLGCKGIPKGEKKDPDQHLAWVVKVLEESVVPALVGMVEDVRTLFPKNRKTKISKGVVAANITDLPAPSPKTSLIDWIEKFYHATPLENHLDDNLHTLCAAISVSASVVALAVISTTVAICVVRHKGKGKNNGKIAASNEFGSPTHYKDVADGISPARYSYSQIKKFTSNFSTKLGEGGFGSIYKGFIQGSGNVAIKLLKLLGYSSQDKKEALVYEFMENGSLDKYFFDEKQEEQYVGKQSISALTSRQLYDIAVETANGILYLHEECRSRILHLDIKPHNVLLNSTFSARVAEQK